MLAVQVQLNNVREVQRHNLVAEQQNLIDLDRRERELQETIRSHKVNESLGFAELYETTRSHKANEQISWYNAETQRKNYGVNLMNAQVNRMNAQTNRLNYQVNLMNANTNAMNAQTNRLGVIYNYELGLKNVRVAEENANTNRKNAFTNEYNARINEMNADTNRLNASISEARYELDVHKFDWDASMDIANFGKDLITSANPMKGSKTTIYRILE